MRVGELTNTMSRFSHCFVVRIGVVEEMGSANIFVSKMGVVGVNIDENESTSLSKISKNGSSWVEGSWLLKGYGGDVIIISLSLSLLHLILALTQVLQNLV